MNKEQNSFLKYLKDKKFIEWKLLQTEELNTYWEEYQRKHPQEKNNFMLAEKHFNQFHLKTFQLTEERKKESLKHLEHSIKSYNRRRINHVITYSAVASLLVLIISLLFIEYNDHKLDVESNNFKGFIVGNELETKEIQLITSEKSTLFPKNIDIVVNNNGKVQINDDKDEKERLKIDVDSFSLNRLIVPFGKRSTLLLADGSKIWLNSGTIIDFPLKFNENTRDIYLTSGEIYMEVAPDKQKSFLVHTPRYDVKVYGTKFNISAYTEEQSSVVLVEGSISLKTNNQKEMLVVPNERVFVTSNGALSKHNVNVDRYISWKNGYLLLDNSPITEVLQVIERYYNISFSYDKEKRLKELTCSGKIILSEDIDNVMETIAILSSTHFRRDNDKVYIINEPKKEAYENKTKPF